MRDPMDRRKEFLETLLERKSDIEEEIEKLEAELLVVKRQLNTYSVSNLGGTITKKPAE